MSAEDTFASYEALSPMSRAEFVDLLVGSQSWSSVAPCEDEEEEAPQASGPAPEEKKSENSAIALRGDPFATGRKRGPCRFSFFVGGKEKNGCRQIEKPFVLQALKRECRDAYGGLNTSAHVDALTQTVSDFVSHPRVARFMVGKCSFDSNDNLHSGMQKRHVNKYKEAGYTKMVGLALQDGGECEQAQETMLKIEWEILLRLRAHPKLDARLSSTANGARVAKPLVKDKIFMIYVALAPVNN